MSINLNNKNTLHLIMKLSLRFLFFLKFYLTAIASVNSVTIPDFDPKNYESQMIIVGKKSDGFIIKRF